jgi:hypothetical protein
MEISKLEAARRQLDCAVRLYFSDDDLCSVITLSRAAFRLLWDIYPKVNNDGFEEDLSKAIKKLGWPRFHEIANFLKHADKDPDAKMEPDDVHARTGIGLSIILYGRETDDGLSPEMKAWETIMTLESPDIWDSHPDPEHEGYESFVGYAEVYRKATRDERLAMGRNFLQAFRRIEREVEPEPRRT